jgi:hypothetical protein
MKKLILGLVAGAALMAAAGANAVPVSYNLGTLIAEGGSITYGDKKFSDFNWVTASGILASSITVTPSNIGSTYYLTFQGPMIAVNGERFDIGLFYSVATTTGAKLLSMIDQSYAISSGGTTGSILIGETVWDAGFGVGNQVAQSSLSYIPGTPPTVDPADPAAELIQGDDLIINPWLSKAWVKKDIFFAANSGGAIGPSIITQSFHQGKLPEPGSLGMLGLGLLAIGFMRKRAN